MKISKIWLYLVIGALTLVALFTQNQNKTIIANGLPPVYLRVEASVDGGATWHNYFDSDNPGGETLPTTSGATVLVRIRGWNIDEEMPYIAGGEGLITNATYISSVNLISLDSDVNDNAYNGYFFGTSGTGEIVLSPNGYEEIATASFTLGNNFPAGETDIEGVVGLTDAILGIGYNPMHKIFGIPKTYAYDISGGIKFSSFRIAVNQALPETGADLN